jgi:alanine racemase
MRATRAIIHTENLKYNLDIIRKLTGTGVKICLAVKADAYGHGSEGISRAAESFGIEYLAVAAVSEASTLRDCGITTPIILLGPILPEETEKAVKLDLEMIISTEGELRRIMEAGAGTSLNVHLKIDTGMGRIGCGPSEALNLSKKISETENIQLSGICTHFPVSDSSRTQDIEFTKKQIKLFNSIVENIRSEGIAPGLIHAANSGAILNYPDAHLDMVRPGIFAYGFLPGSDEGLLSELSTNLKPKPVMSFESKLMHIKQVPPGTYISYGRTFKTDRKTWIGTIPVGYADGYNRRLSNSAWVMINGEKCPVVGTVCMDQLMVDLGPVLKMKLYDRTVLFGFEKGAPTAEDLTDITGSIPYELLCAISKRVPRLFI